MAPARHHSRNSESVWGLTEQAFRVGFQAHIEISTCHYMAITIHSRHNCAPDSNAVPFRHTRTLREAAIEVCTSHTSECMRDQPVKLLFCRYRNRSFCELPMDALTAPDMLL